MLPKDRDWRCWKRLIESFSKQSQFKSQIAESQLQLTHLKSRMKKFLNKTLCKAWRKCHISIKPTFLWFLWNKKHKTTVMHSSSFMSQSQMMSLLLLWTAFYPNWGWYHSANFKFLALSRLNECSRYCTALPIYDNFRRPSLNGVTTTHVSATSATITATMNHVPTIRSATTKCHNSSLVETKQLELNKRRWFQAFCIPQKWFR